MSLLNLVLTMPAHVFVFYFFDQHGDMHSNRVFFCVDFSVVILNGRFRFYILVAPWFELDSSSDPCFISHSLNIHNTTPARVWENRDVIGLYGRLLPRISAALCTNV